MEITVCGWVATEPKEQAGPTGVRMTTFRVATTVRYFDKESQDWKDGSTEWFSVRVYRAAASNVAASIRKGNPVIVHGRFRTNEWESDTGTRVDLVIDATAVGHDLTRGTATFTRSTIDPDADAKDTTDANAA